MSKAIKAPRNTLALTLEFEGNGTKSKIEIHTLNPGEAFPNFGGSKHACIAGKTASIITRTFNVGTQDYEQDIYAPDFWSWIGRLITRTDQDGKPFDSKITVVLPGKGA